MAKTSPATVLAHASKCVGGGMPAPLRAAALDACVQAIHALAKGAKDDRDVHALTKTLLGTNAAVLLAHALPIMAPLFARTEKMPPAIFAWDGTPTPDVGGFLEAAFTAHGTLDAPTMLAQILRFFYASGQHHQAQAMHALFLHMHHSLPAYAPGTQATTIATLRMRASTAFISPSKSAGLRALDTLLVRTIPARAWNTAFEALSAQDARLALGTLHAFVGPSGTMEVLRAAPRHVGTAMLNPTSHHEALALVRRFPQPHDLLGLPLGDQHAMLIAALNTS